MKSIYRTEHQLMSETTTKKHKVAQQRLIILSCFHKHTNANLQGDLCSSWVVEQVWIGLSQVFLLEWERL